MWPSRKASGLASSGLPSPQLPDTSPGPGINTIIAETNKGAAIRKIDSDSTGSLLLLSSLQV